MAEKKSVKPNIVVIIFVFIMIYMTANIIAYLVKPHISITEIEAGHIIDSDSFTGLIIREEKALQTTSSGRVTYIVADGEKVSRGSNICMVGNSSSSQVETDPSEICKDVFDEFKGQISQFKKNYSDSDFEQTYSLDYKLTSILGQSVSRQTLVKLGNRQTTGASNYIAAREAGIVSYTVDGYEGYTEQNITEELFNKDNVDRKQIIAGSSVESTDQICKLVTENKWSVYIIPTDQQLSKLKKISSAIDQTRKEEAEAYHLTYDPEEQNYGIKLHILKDDITADAVFSVFQKAGHSYVRFDLDNYMVRYISDRMLDFEIVWMNYDGLKIPKTAITEKAFYKIPLEYQAKSQEDASISLGFYTLVDEQQQLISPTVFRKDDRYCYVPTDEIDEGTMLLDPEDQLNQKKAYTVKSTVNFQGVFNVNKGYARFRLLETLYEYGDYVICKKNTEYGASLYDRIILDSSKISENDTIY